MWTWKSLQFTSYDLDLKKRKNLINLTVFVLCFINGIVGKHYENMRGNLSNPQEESGSILSSYQQINCGEKRE